MFTGLPLLFTAMVVEQLGKQFDEKPCERSKSQRLSARGDTQEEEIPNGVSAESYQGIVIGNLIT